MGFIRYFDLLILLLFGLIWLGLVIFLRVKKKKRFVYLILFTLFYIYLFKVLDITIIQFQSLLILRLFTPDLILRGGTAEQSMNLFPLITLTLEDLKTSLLNILMLIPFGFGLPLINKDLSMKKIIVMGALLSIAIELIQLITGLLAKMTFRIADINDVIFNTAGVVVGYFAFVILKKWIHLRNYKNIVISALIAIAVVATIVYGVTVYEKSQPVKSRVGAGAEHSARFDDKQEGEMSQSGDPCGGTGGNGQIVSIGKNTFILKRKEDSRLIVKLSDRAMINTSSGSAVLSDLKQGDRVTLVGGPNIDGSFTADTVVVCNGTKK